MTSALDRKVVPKYPVLGADPEVTFKRLLWLAIAAPIVIVAILEGMRQLTIGSISLRDRLTLDLIVAGAFMVFGFIMVRAVSGAHRKLERQNAELLALHGAGLDVSAELGLDAVLDKVVERARALVGARYGALSVVDAQGRIQSFITSGISTEERERIGPPPVGHGLLGVVLHHGEHLRLGDLGKDPRSQGFPANHPAMKSLLAVPVTCKSPFVGNIYLAEKAGGAQFSPSDEETLERFAVQAGIAIDNAYLHQQLADLAVARERQNAELLALHGAGLDVSAELALDAVLDKVVERARLLVGSQYGALSVVDSNGRIQAFITSGISPQQRERIGPPPVGHGLLGVVLHHGEHLRLDDLTTDPRSQGFPPNHPPMKSLLAVPITCKGPFVGNLYLAEKEGGAAFTPSDEESLERFAVQAAIAIDNAHLHQQVADLAVARERLHIAHEMHDGVSQVLGYVNTKVQAATEYIRRGNTEEATTQLRELAAAAREAYGDVRESIIDLRTLPEPDRKFATVLEEYLGRWKEQTGISTQLTIDADLTMATSAELQLVRIVQESLTNIRKHSRATTARVEVRRREGVLAITISDDGVGFNQAQPSRSEFPRFGLSTMKERASSIGGTLVVDSTPGEGTRVRVTVPLTSA